MATYEMTFSCPGGIAAGAPICSFHATSRPVRIKEMRIINGSATATKCGLAPGAAVGTVVPLAGGQLVPNPRNPLGAASTMRVDTTWTSAPAAPVPPVQYSRNEDIGGSVGVGVSWPFPEPEEIPIGYIQTLFNTAGGANGALDITVVYDE
jgi:hypothetical protein